MKNVKNKIYAVGLMALATLSMLLDHDATVFVIAACISVPMFFAKEDWIG